MQGSRITIVELEIPQKFQKILKKETNEMEKLVGNILKHLLQYKTLQAAFIIVYDLKQCLQKHGINQKLEELWRENE